MILPEIPSYPAEFLDLNDSITCFTSVSVVGSNFISSIESFLLSCKSVAASFLFELSVTILPAAVTKYLLKGSAIFFGVI